MFLGFDYHGPLVFLWGQWLAADQRYLVELDKWWPISVRATSRMTANDYAEARDRTAVKIASRVTEKTYDLRSSQFYWTYNLRNKWIKICFCYDLRHTYADGLQTYHRLVWVSVLKTNFRPNCVGQNNKMSQPTVAINSNVNRNMLIRYLFCKPVIIIIVSVDVSNYRPISLACISSKIMERVIVISCTVRLNMAFLNVC